LMKKILGLLQQMLLSPTVAPTHLNTR